MSRVIAVANQKGGVGKTSVVENLGAGLAKSGRKVCVVDLDPQGSLTASMGYAEPDTLSFTITNIMMGIINDEPLNWEDGVLHHEEGVDLIPANIELSGLEVSLSSVMSREMILKEFIDQLRECYDVIILDCMPSLGIMTINALVAADEVLIPVCAAYLPALGLTGVILKGVILSYRIILHYREMMTMRYDTMRRRVPKHAGRRL